MESVLPICRICLNSSKDFIDFQAHFECDDCYADALNQMNYLQCLRFCTNISISENDGGPQCLCTGCAIELQLVYKFLQKVKSSQDILEENLWKIDSNNEQFQHTEICIETCDGVEIEDLSSTDGNEVYSNNTEHLNDYPQNSSEPSNFCDELPTELNGKLKNTVKNYCDSIEEVKTNEHGDETLHDIEYLLDDYKNLHKDTPVFIPKKYKCYICNRSYTTEHHLKVHLYYHRQRSLKNPQYICKICGETFSMQRFLTKHMIEHQDCRETYKCQFCEKEYVSKTALISHKRVHQAETLTCNECGKQFNGRYEFNVHLRFHKREKELDGIKCHICYKEFSSSRYLPHHMSVHLDSKERHSCNYCDKKYRSKTALNNHERLHEGKTLQCNVCEKHFTRNSELKIHMRFHKRERPFKCTLCQKDFTIKGHLRSHMWQHQRLKVECDKCGKLFGSTKALNEHSYTHTQMPFPCEFCNKGYPSKQKYKIHLEKVHCSEKNNIDLSKKESSTKDNITKMRKKYTFVQMLNEDEN